MRLEQLLKNRKLNGWNLFWLIVIPLSLTMVFAMSRADLSRAESVSAMIQLSVRLAVPWLYLAFAASALAAVFRGPFSRWLLRNRRIVGLCFAAGMGWQLFFILWLVGVHTDYYVGEVYVLSDVIEGIVGYAFLIAMVLTSFRFGRRHLSPKQWKLLHTAGIYWLWIYAWSVYWFNVFYYAEPGVLIDYVYYWSGLLAWILRLYAWVKKKSQTRPARTDGVGASSTALLAVCFSLLAIGLVGASIGRSWNPQVYDFLFGFPLVEAIDSFMPYFPMVPFYPVFIMTFAAFLSVKSNNGLSGHH